MMPPWRTHDNSTLPCISVAAHVVSTRTGLMTTTQTSLLCTPRRTGFKKPTLAALPTQTSSLYTDVAALCNKGCGDFRTKRWLGKANEIQGYAASKTVYGPTSKGTTQLLNADGITLLIETTHIFKRWFEYFRSVLDSPFTIPDAVIDRPPQVKTNADLDNPPSFQETIRSSEIVMVSTSAPNSRRTKLLSYR
ncbi:unnamed protein product [Schistocephalus solidus]|uniref:Uncharacterized protein n=1 Tax=Schistocephalus solidus TaxID=70667 RepID=A0A183TQV7_SCHSO|nr:unnamed protein product [Schistocephalus solidus]